LVLYIKNIYRESRFTIFGLILGVDICLISFITWGFAGSSFPWFLFIWAVFIVGVVFLWKTNRITLFTPPVKTIVAQDIENNNNNESSNDSENEEKPSKLYPNI